MGSTRSGEWAAQGRSQVLDAVGHEMQQEAPDKFLGCQRHGLYLIPLTPMAICEAHAAVAHLQEAVRGEALPPQTRPHGNDQRPIAAQLAA
jgi:hypothetical protein